jgi:hypothetical protein
MVQTKRHATAAVILTVLMFMLLPLLTSCGEKPAGPGATTADYIFSRKNQFIGDAPANEKVLGALGVHDFGIYTIALKTDEKPYTVTINFSELKEAKSEVEAKMKIRAPIILALISNADEVHWTIDGNESSYAVSDWNDENGTDIKSYGDSATGISNLLNAVGYNR